MYYTSLPLLLGGIPWSIVATLSLCVHRWEFQEHFCRARCSRWRRETPVTKDMIDAAARIAGITIADEYKKAMLEDLSTQSEHFEAIYKLHMPNGVRPR